LFIKSNYKDGNRDGLWEYYLNSGEFNYKENWKDGEEIALPNSD
jgi:antitoxin component YwqK of YwqJK toxin-antitoxin module